MEHIPDAVIRQDRALQAEIQKRTAAAADSTMRLDAYRWEQCACPDGPKYDYAEYGRAVGRDERPIARSCNAWAPARTGRSCTLGAPHPRDTDQPTVDRVDTNGKTIEQHQQDRTVARVGQDRAAIVAEIARRTGLAESTITNNVNWSGCRTSAAAHVGEGLPIEEAVMLALDEKAAEEQRNKECRAYVRNRLAAANLPAEKGDVARIIGLADSPPTREQLDEVITDAIRKRDREKKWNRKDKEQEAQQKSRPAWFLEILNVAVAGANVMQHEREKIKGDPSAVHFDDDLAALLWQEVARAEEHLQWLRDLPLDHSAITPEAIIEGGR